MVASIAVALVLHYKYKRPFAFSPKQFIDALIAMLALTLAVIIPSPIPWYAPAAVAGIFVLGVLAIIASGFETGKTEKLMESLPRIPSKEALCKEARDLADVIKSYAMQRDATAPQPPDTQNEVAILNDSSPGFYTRYFASRKFYDHQTLVGFRGYYSRLTTVATGFASHSLRDADLDAELAKLIDENPETNINMEAIVLALGFLAWQLCGHAPKG